MHGIKLETFSASIILQGAEEAPIFGLVSLAGNNLLQLPKGKLLEQVVCWVNEINRFDPL